MKHKKTLLNFIVEDDLLERIEDFRFKNRFPTRAAAIKWLLDWGLEQKPSPGRRRSDQRVESVRPEPEPLPPTPVTAVTPPKPTPPPLPKPVLAKAVSLESVMQALRDQDYEIVETANDPAGRDIVLVRARDRSAWVQVSELEELAAGRTTLADLALRKSRS